MSFLEQLSQHASKILENEFNGDSKTQREIFNYDTENKQFKIGYKKSVLRARKFYGAFTFFLVWFWLLIVLYIVLSHGLGALLWMGYKFSLDSNIIIFLITTTTAGVLVSLNTIIKNLFPIPNSNKNKESTP